MAEFIFFLIFCIIFFEVIFTSVLSYLNYKAWKTPLSKIGEELYTEDEFFKAKSYADENYKLGRISGFISFLPGLLFFYFKGYAWLDQLLRTYIDHPVLITLAFFAILTLVSSIISLPFSYYSTFYIEEKYGFNKTTKSLFFLDWVKGLLLGAVIGGLLLGLISWFFYFFLNDFWWLAWLIVSGFTLFMATFYTTLLLPLFNKLSPLKEGNLLEQIRSYASKVEFPLTNIFVMDGSKRSSKANAFFSGLGTKKNIVLFDTLIEQLTEAEIISVLAHETGHYKKNHVPISMILAVLQMGVLFLLFGWISSSPLLYESLGAKTPSFHLALITFSLLYSPVSLLTGILMNVFSRKNEYEADEYAASTYSTDELISGLKKIYKNSLGQPNPHPAYVYVYYSHPTLIQRIEALRKIKDEK